ncbi:MAG: type IV secretion system DNA-binding domain-containing protein [Cyanobacteria bacterium J06636_27]
MRETAAVLPSELQNLPSLEGYLVIADGSSPARVKVTPKSYPSDTPRFIPIEKRI